MAMETYYQFNGGEDDTSLKSWQIGVRDEPPNKSQQKCSSHEVGECCGRLC